MKTRILTTASVLALAISMPAYAAETIKPNAAAEPTAEQRLERGWENTKDTVNRAANNVSESARETYNTVKASVMDQQSGTPQDVLIDSRMTAEGMIGKSLLNTNGETIARIRDIIVDENGQALLIVVSDSGPLGFAGKEVAFDYGRIISQTAEGDVMAPLTEEQLKLASEFSYDRTNSADNVRVIPEGGYSVSDILKAKLVNPEARTVADVENLSFRNGEIDRLIVAFDKTLGMGGKKAALNYSDVTLGRDGNRVVLALDSEQAAQFENFKKQTTR